jgi:hypothetical protein
MSPAISHSGRETAFKVSAFILPLSAFEHTRHQLPVTLSFPSSLDSLSTLDSAFTPYALFVTNV